MLERDGWRLIGVDRDHHHFKHGPVGEGNRAAHPNKDIAINGRTVCLFRSRLAREAMRYVAFDPQGSWLRLRGKLSGHSWLSPRSDTLEEAAQNAIEASAVTFGGWKPTVTQSPLLAAWMKSSPIPNLQSGGRVLRLQSFRSSAISVQRRINVSLDLGLLQAIDGAAARRKPGRVRRHSSPRPSRRNWQTSGASQKGIIACVPQSFAFSPPPCPPSRRTPLISTTAPLPLRWSGRSTMRSTGMNMPGRTPISATAAPATP